MDTEQLTIIRVIEDHHVLESGGTLSINFMPSEGPTVIRAHSSTVPDDVIIGGSPTPGEPAVRLVDDAHIILDSRFELPPLSRTEMFVLANNGVALNPAIGPVTPLAAQPQLGLGDDLLGGGGGVFDPPPPKDNIRMEILRPADGGGAPRVVFSSEISGRGGGSFSIANLPLVPVGFAPPSGTWEGSRSSTGSAWP